MSEGLPEGWVDTTLGEICSAPQYGWTTSASKTGTVRFLRTTDISAGRLDWERVPFCSEVPHHPDKYRLKSGDIVISRAGSIGLSELIEEPPDAVFASYLIRFRPSGQLDAKYVSYYLKSPAYWQAVREMASGIALQNINATKLSAVPVPLAPRATQSRIVAEIQKQFTRLDNAVASLKRVQANLKRYRASVLKAACEGRLVPTEAELARKEGRSYESGEQLLARILRERRAKWEADQLATMLAAGKPADDERWKHDYREPVRPNVAALPRLPEGWEWACADQLLSHVTSGSRNWADHYCEHGALFIRAQDIKTDTLDLSSPAHVQLPQGAEGIRTRVRGDDILVTITGANVSKTARVTQAPAEAYVSQHVALLRPVLPLISPFLYHWIVSPANGRRDLLTKAYGAGKPGLNLDNIRELPVPLPPADEQVRITKELDIRFSALERFAELIGRNLDRSTGLRQASLKTAFSGRLVPQDPSDEPASVLLERIRAERAAKGKAPVQRRSASAR